MILSFLVIVFVVVGWLVCKRKRKTHLKMIFLSKETKKVGFLFFQNYFHFFPLLKKR